MMQSNHESRLIPSVERFVAALERLAPPLTPKRLKMIRTHYCVPGRALTATQLAHAAGNKSYRAVNLQYGLLGRRLALLMGWNLPKEAQASYACAAFYRPQTNLEWRWEMHAPFAEALRRCGLV